MSSDINLHAETLESGERAPAVPGSSPGNEQLASGAIESPRWLSRT